MSKIKVYKGHLPSGKVKDQLFAVVEGRERYIALNLDGDWDVHREFVDEPLYGVYPDRVFLASEIHFECDDVDTLINYGKTMQLLGISDE